MQMNQFKTKSKGSSSLWRSVVVEGIFRSESRIFGEVVIPVPHPVLVVDVVFGHHALWELV